MIDPRSWEDALQSIESRLVGWLSRQHALAQAAPLVLVVVTLLQWDSLWDSIRPGMLPPGLLPFLSATRDLWIPFLLLGLTTPLIPRDRIEFASGAALFLTLAWAGWMDSPWKMPLLGAAFAMLGTAILFQWRRDRVSVSLAPVAIAFCVFAVAANAFFPDLVRSRWLSWAPLSYALFAFAHLLAGLGRDLDPARAMNPGHFLGGLLLPRRPHREPDPALWTRGLIAALIGLCWFVMASQLLALAGPTQAVARFLAGAMSFVAAARLAAGLARLYGVDLPDPIGRPWLATRPRTFLHRCARLETTFAKQTFVPFVSRVFRAPRAARACVPFTILTLVCAREPAAGPRLIAVVLIFCGVDVVFARKRTPERGRSGSMDWLLTQSSFIGAWIIVDLVIEHL